MKALQTLCTIVALSVPATSSALIGGDYLGPELRPREPQTYEVKKGDTLWDIAKKECGHGMKYVNLASYNGIPDPDKIKVGQELYTDSGACNMSVGRGNEIHL